MTIDDTQQGRAMAGQCDGVTLRTTFKEHITARRDAAHAGDWDTL
ncbi:hypothetical protein ACOBQX_05680 [Actinokineospora sp. G85]